MKKLLLFASFAFLFLMMMASASALIWSNTTFNNSLISERLDFTADSNFTRYLSVPSTVSFLTNGFLNLSGANQAFITNGLVSYWNFDNNVNDSVGGFNFTNFGGSFIAGKKNNKLNLSVNAYAATAGNYPISGNTNRTISFWGQFNDIPSQANFFKIISAGGVGVPKLFNMGVTGGEWHFQGGGAGNEFSFGTNDTALHNHVITYNGTGVTWFIDGVEAAGHNVTLNTEPAPLGISLELHGAGDNNVSVNIDEMAFWNRTLSDSEIDELYNGGGGLFFAGFGNVSLTIGDTFNGLNIGVNGTSNVTVRTSNLASTINRHLNSTFLVGSNYLIPFLFRSDTAGPLNYSFLEFNNLGLIENSQTFSNSTTSLSVEVFTLNVSFDPNRYSATANLIYNDTSFSASSSSFGNDRVFTATVTIPAVAAAINKSFHWEIALTDSSNTTNFNSTFNNQTVNPLLIDDCSSFSFLILNYTLRDEDTQALSTVPNNASIKIDVDIFAVGSTTASIKLSQDYNETNQALVCLESQLGNSTFTMDVQTQYSQDDYATEFHNIQSFNLTNTSVPQVIPLLNLLTSRAETFVITVKDTNFLPLEGAIVDVTRKYVADGVFRSVEVPVTDPSGQASISLVQSTEIYTFIISKGGIVLATFNNVVATCQNQVTKECNIFLNLFSGSTELTDFETVGGLTFSEVFDRPTRTITVTFTTADGSNALMFINTTRFDRFGNTTVCSDTLLSSSGSLTCLVPESFGNVTVQSQIFKDGSLISSNFYNLNDGAPEFGANGIIMALILIITLPLMFITSPIGIVIGAMIGVITAGSLLLFTGGSLFGVTSSIMWLIIAGSILVWRMIRGGET